MYFGILFQVWLLVWSGKEVRCHYSKSALNLRDDVNSEKGGGVVQ